jgi:gliding motility-associated-like protein
MKKIFSLLTAIFITTICLAQPANDDCAGIIDLGDAPICPSPVIYSNFNATTSDIGNDNLPPCFNGAPERDVWFSFTATAAIANYEVSVIGSGGSPIVQPQVAVYRGNCGFDQLVLLDCATAAAGDSELTLNLAGLTPGITYFLRVNDWSANNPNWGQFELCIQEMVQTEFTVNQTGSDLCSGTLYDTGGPSGNYGNNENHIFTICPTDPPACLIFNLAQYNIENGGDNLIFYDGPTINSPIIASISDGASSSNGDNLGGVCYQLAATSGCITVHFLSNSFSNFEGFVGTWECADVCPQNSNLDIEIGASFDAIENALQNPYFDIQVTDLVCNEQSYGLFQQADNTGLGLNDGLLLTTGRAEQVSNPASFHADNDLNQFGDPDLNLLDATFGIGNSLGTSDVCYVELEVLSKTNRIGFDYVFGSDEYEQNFSAFSDDLMAVLLSGPGINGLPQLGGQQNLAWVPGSNDQELIQIQRINAATNWEYFRNNLDNPSIVYNGLTSGFLGETKTLYAGREVTPCETYKVKIAIGDTDSNDDSGLFIQSSSFGYPSISLNTNTGIDYLVEGCTNVASDLVIKLPAALSQDFTPNVVIGGTATPLLDYQVAIPVPPTIPAGTTEISFPLTVVADGIPEGTETIEISLTGDFGCGTVIFSTVFVEIKDQIEVNILPDMDTIFVCDGIFTAELQATGAASYSWEPAAVFSNPNAAMTTATIATSQTVSVTGTLGTCTDTDEVFLQIVSPTVDIQPNGPLQICEGESVQLSAVNNVNDAGLEWSPSLGLSDPQSAQTMAQPSLTTTYTATVRATDGCSASDEITINVEPFKFPEWVIGDSVICQNSSVQLAAKVPSSTTIFEWTPTDGLDDPAIANATATPDVTTTYSLTATSENGLCTQSASFTITVLPADVNIIPDTIDLCIGDSTLVQGITSTGGVGLTWSPTDSLTIINAETVSVKPGISTWYFATLEVGICTVVDSVFVRVDSLPQMTGIEAIPAKDTYCQGEVISLVSPNYEPAFYPDIMFQWVPSTGAISEDTLFNLAINAVTTTTYVREITNNACSSSDSIEIVVIPVANIEITPQNPLICPGESVDFVATADQPIDEWEWSPATGLSCTDCTNPTATPPGTITYQVQGEFMGCPSFAQVTVQVAGASNYAFPAVTNICLGQSIVLNTVVDPNAMYQWLNPDGSVLSDQAQPEVSPTVNTTYTLIISTGNCPPITDEVTIGIQEDYTLTVGEDLIACANEEIVLTASASSPNVGFVWTNISGDTIVDGIIPANSIIAGSSNTFFVEALDTPPCFPHTDQVQVTTYPSFNLTTSADQSTIGGVAVTLQADADLAGVTFSWENSAGEIIGTGNSITVSPCETEVYTVVAMHPNGCASLEDQVTINVNADFNLTVSDDQTINGGESVTLSASADLAGVTFTWLNNGMPVGDGNNLTVSPCNSEIYYVLGNHPNGCPSKIDSVLVTVNSSFTIDSLELFVMDSMVIEVYEGGEINGSVVTMPSPIQGATFEWFIDTTLVATSNSTNSGLFNAPELPDGVEMQPATFSVTVTNADGCTQELTINITILNNPVLIPNVFTPNGDSMNDDFTDVSRVPVDIVSLRIWDRWGKKVFDNEDDSGVWDGMIKDKAAASDVYIYQIQYTIVGGTNIYTERGDVTLLR